VMIPPINIAEPMNMNVFSNREGIVRGPRDQRLYHFLSNRFSDQRSLGTIVTR
jgi:hypothetical protein